MTALRRRGLALLFALAPTLGLAACGGDDGVAEQNVPVPADGGEGDPDEVDAVTDGERPGLGGDDTPAVDEDGDIVTGDAEE